MFRESRFLDTSRLGKIFPMAQVRLGSSRRSRRCPNGYVGFNKSAIGKFDRLLASEIFGNVPVGSFVRQIIVDLFNFLDVDILDCNALDVSLLSFY